MQRGDSESGSTLAPAPGGPASGLASPSAAGSSEFSAPPPLRAVSATMVVLTAVALAWWWLAEGVEISPAAQSPAGLLAVLLPWTAACLALLVAIFALAIWIARGGALALLLSGLLPAAALAGILHAGGIWRQLHALEPDLPSTSTDWLASRLVVALGIQLAWLQPGLHRRFARASASSRFWAATGLMLSALGLVASARLLHSPEWFFWAGLATMALLLAGAPLALGLHRRERGALTYAAVASLIPYAVAQAMTLLPTKGTHGVLLDDALTVLAIAGLFAGVVLDTTATHQATARMSGELRTMELDGRRIRRELLREVEQSESWKRRLRVLDVAVERMQLGVTITDTDGRIVYVNEADAHMHGYRREELIGQTGSIYGVPEAQAEPSAPAGARWWRETRNRTKDGHEFPVRLISDTVRDDHGELQAHVTVCEDISGVRWALDTLARRDRVLVATGLAAEEFLAGGDWTVNVPKVLAALGEATSADQVSLRTTGAERPPARWSWSRDGQLPVGEAPGALDAYLRETPAAWCGKLPDLPARARALFEASAVGSAALVPVEVGGQSLGLLSLLLADSTREWAASEMEALGTAARSLAAAIRNQRAQEAVAASEAAYRDVVEGAHDMIQSVDEWGGFRFVNQAWLQRLGYRREELVSLNLFDVLPPAQHQRYREALTRLGSSAAAEQLEIVLRSKSGSELAVEGQLGVHRNRDQTVSTVGIFRDVTEQRRVERMKQEFLGTVSHELRTPLTSIIGALGLLRSERLRQRPEKQQELLAIAARNGERLLRLVNDLLDLQSLEAGELRLHLADVPVSSLVDDAVREIEGFASIYHISVRGERAPTLGSLTTDRSRLGQVFSNLLSNAIKFSPAGCEVVFAANAEGEEVVFAVRDRGAGIPIAFQNRLFERFAQADTSEARKQGGTGLGLSISKKLVLALGGRMAVESVPEQGTTVTVWLPRGEAAAVPATVSRQGENRA
jgi:PAS domain S-box-containing protein